MVIQFANGRTMEGVALARNGNTMRVALRGHNDALELFEVNGCWLTEDWEPVLIRTVEASDSPSFPSESEFVCPMELASRLIQMLRPGPWGAAPSAYTA
jgi:hypothetical protein